MAISLEQLEPVGVEDDDTIQAVEYRWSTVHNQLIVAIADTLTPKLLPHYQVDIEKRIYEVMGFNSLLVGRADVSVQQPRQTTDSSATASSIAIAAQPQKVSLPTAEEVREAYLEVREVTTQRVITVIEVLHPPTKRAADDKIFRQTPKYPNQSNPLG